MVARQHEPRAPRTLQTRDLEACTDTVFTCFRYLPAIGRFLIVVTFLEDSLRILTQWNDQLLYLRDFRKSKLYPDWTLARN